MPALDIFCPRPGSSAASLLPAGSAVVGTRLTEGRLRVTVVHAGGFHRGRNYADLVKEAAAAWPRRAAEVDAADYDHVAVWDHTFETVRLRAGNAASPLDRWLGRRAYRNDLEATDSPENTRQDARMHARRLDMQGRSHEAMALRSRHGIGHW